jgi:Arm DNA-binding domain
VRNGGKSCYRFGMPILPHNQRAIEGLKTVDGKRTSYTSEVVPGLLLEVMPSGRMTWRVRYRTPGGRQGMTRAYTIGDASVVKLGPAVDKAREVLGTAQLEGRDPQSERRPSGNTFEAVFNDWLDKHAKPKKKSWEHDEAMYHRHVHGRIGHMVASEIKRADVAAALDDVVRVASGTQANRAQALISSIFNWAVNEGRLEHTPTYRIPKRGVEVLEKCPSLLPSRPPRRGGRCG